jgi:hypothetical protein
MLTISKRNGATSTAGATAKKGNKGRLELRAERTDDGFRVRFEDYGNYGRIRWEADFGSLDENGILDIIESLQELLAGDADSTAVAFVEPQEQTAEVEAEAEPVEAEEAEASSEEPEVPAEALEAPESAMDQLEA